MRHSIKRDFAEVFGVTDRLISLMPTISAIEVGQRKLVCEIVLIRLFLALENSTKSIFSKLACETPYLDGSQPVVLHPSKTMKGAIGAMQTLSRPKHRQLRWTDSKEIRENIRFIIASNDHCYSVVTSFAAKLTEMRYIRNHIAHNNETTRKNFHKIVRRRYGALRKGMTPGTMLLSKRGGNNPLLEDFIHVARAFIKDLTKA